MGKFAKPRVVVSKCLGFAPCRYNGAVISGTFAERLRGHVTFCPVCPEMEIGLGCPRDPIRIVVSGGERRLVQPATGKDLSGAMREFAERFLDSVGEVDGFLLKGRSPSCGISDVKVYDEPEGEAFRREGRGFFAEAVLERFGHLPIEDERALEGATARERFLARLRSAAALRQARAGRIGP